MHFHFETAIQFFAKFKMGDEMDTPKSASMRQTEGVNNDS
ncbi:hypothetical protein N474_23050 [Pseudoalteromonas luteoviolacea CPMOR-2]|nr:hypothetical protein N474_23050 [Pseudoalteromonas luteoviolacea CPMOR-2]